MKRNKRKTRKKIEDMKDRTDTEMCQFYLICSKTNITKKLDKQLKLCYKIFRTDERRLI